MYYVGVGYVALLFVGDLLVLLVVIAAFDLVKVVTW